MATLSVTVDMTFPKLQNGWRSFTLTNVKSSPVPELTIFTPAYNRAHTLPRTYDSLCRQSCKDFIWLIVDDGSQDNTAELVQQWQTRDNGFEIQYIYKENGGMHTAHNVAYAHIHTELNVCIDSDDLLADGAVEFILDFWRQNGSKKYAGIVGLDADLSGKIIGTAFPAGLRETTLNGFYASGGKGDKKQVYRTDIMQSLPPYPVFAGERYVSLGYKYLLCDQHYPLLCVNRILCNVDYQSDGSSATMLYQYRRNPKGFAFIRKVHMHYPRSYKRLFIECIHYCSSSILAKNRHFLRESPKKLLTVLAFPPGLLLTVYILLKTKGPISR